MNNSPTKIDIDAFRWRLAETITWCGKRASLTDPKDCLRTESLRPPSFWYGEAVYPKQLVVDSLLEQRAKDLRGWQIDDYPTASADSLQGGRLLLYDPDQNLADGAAEDESLGFFNVNNEPAWDTWVSYIRFPDESEKRNRIYLRGEYVWSQLRGDYFNNCLVSWIPPQLVDLVTRGVNVNPEQCIAWADDTEIALTRELRGAGLLS